MTPHVATCLLVLVALGGVCGQSDLPAPNYQPQLLAQRNAITNWENYKKANNIVGWEDGDLTAFGKHPVCQWTGIRCDDFDKSVIALDLGCHDNCTVQAEGSLAPELAEIATLQTLTLNGQLFGGPLPETWGAEGSFTNLKTLLLDNNQLNGTLPAGWGAKGAFPDLVNLKLSLNTLSSTLPASWGNKSGFPALEQLYLDFNTLSGTLPASWASAGAFPKLRALYMGSNTFTGTLPAAWGTSDAFQSLTDLEVSACTLTGSLPPGWGGKGVFPKLLIMELSANQLNGTLPPSWGSDGAFPALGSLGLSLNLLSGSIPSAWAGSGSFPNLTAAALGDNPSLCGPVPEKLFPAVCDAPAPFGTTCVGAELPACTALFPPATDSDVAALLAQKAAISNWAAVFPSMNGWTKQVPVCEWSGVECSVDTGSIIKLDLSCPSAEEVKDLGTPACGARPQGTLAPQLATISTLQTISVISLGVSGSLPADWGKAGSFENLNELYLDNNALTGTLPGAWATAGAFPKLKALSLGNNSLTGAVPLSWGDKSALPVLSYIYLADNGLQGPLPDPWGDPTALPYLAFMDVSNNPLNTALPTAWGRDGSFPRLSEIHLVNATLTGPLPDSWGTAGAFPKLNYLSLINNSLTGSIPAAWNGSDSLPKMNTLLVSGNQLCGAVPETLLNPVCGEDPSQCNGNAQLTCAAPAPAPSPDSSSSSTPVGAIVGGVLGGLALLAVLAFLALRPRKGWLRRGAAVRTGKVASKQGKGGADAELGRDVDDDESDMGKKGGMPLLPPVDPSTFTLVQTRQLQQDGEGPPEDQLPFSYITTAGYGKEVRTAGGTTSDAASDMRTPFGAAAPQSSQTDSLHSLETDPVLTFISSRLATMRRTAALSPTSSSVLTASSGPLPAEVQQWEVQWEAIQLERPIGRGSFGKVYLASWNATPVAVKILINSDGVEQAPDLELPDDVMRQLQEEAVVMSRMRHPNLVSFMGLCTLPPCILTEYCSRGSLYDVLRAAAWRPECAAELTWPLRLSMAFDAARGLLYLHLRTPPIIHRDVKSPNMLVDRNWNVKVCDFNLSEILRHQPAHDPDMGGEATNPTWLAPEVLRGERPTAASDVYSFALVLWELLTWRLPWARMPPYQVRRAVLEGSRPDIPAREQLPGPDSATFDQLDAYCQLMRDCWAQNPAHRPSFADIVPRLSGMLDVAEPGTHHSSPSMLT